MRDGRDLDIERPGPAVSGASVHSTGGTPGAEGVAGSLASLSLAELCQTLALSSRSGHVRLTRLRETGDVWFDHGEAVHARTGNLEGEAAFFEMLRWGDGHFEITDDASPPSHSLSGDPMYLVLEGLRRIDEETAPPDAEDGPSAAPRSSRRRLAVALSLAVLALGAAATGLWLTAAREEPAASPVDAPSALESGVELARASEARAADEPGPAVPTTAPETRPTAGRRRPEPAPTVRRAAFVDPAPLPAADLDPIGLVASLLPARYVGPVFPRAEAPAPSGILTLDVVSRVESGRLIVAVDGETRVDREVRWDGNGARRLFQRIAGTAGDRFVERIELPAGPHDVVATLVVDGSGEPREIRLDIEVAADREADLRLVALRKRGGRLEIRDPR